MYDTLEEWRGVEIDRATVEEELGRHGVSWEALEEDEHRPWPNGSGYYDAAEVLEWLGY